jgi:hypothetical protein
VSVLCDRGEYQLVCEYPYFSLLEHINPTLANKAEMQDVIATVLADNITFYEVRILPI